MIGKKDPDSHDSQGALIHASSASLYESSYCYIPARYVLAFLSFLGFANVYALRVNLSVAIVGMVKKTPTGPVSENRRHVQFLETA